MKCSVPFVIALTQGLLVCVGPAVGQDRPAVNPVASAPPTAPLVKTNAPMGKPGASVVKPLAKQPPGSISGRVSTPTGEPIIGASVDIVKVGSPHKRFEAESDRDGKFVFSQLEPGLWKVSVAAAGMLASEERVTIGSAHESHLDVELEDIEASDVLRITGKRTLIHPDKIGTTTGLDRKFLEEFGSGNDLRKDIETTPGVIQDSVGSIITRGEHNAVNYELDGVILPEAAGVLNQAQFASPRSLESVSVDIGGYQAKDGGGPLGAVVRMKSLPIPEKPTARFGTQLGGPIQGGLNYYAAGALSLNSNSILNKVRIESSGTVYGTRLGIEPPVKRFARNGRASMNFLSKIEFTPTDKDRFKVTVGLNESFLGWPTSRTSQRAGVRINQFDREDYVIIGYRRLGEKFFDEANLNIVNSFYTTRLTSRNVFDPTPILVGDEPLLASTAATATRFNYALSVQGDIRKKIRSHNATAGFLSEVRPVRTNYSAFYYNLDPSQPYGALISPFSRMPGDPQFLGKTGNYKGFRYLQSAYIQDVWRPDHGILKRLTIDAGVRVDVYHGVFGNTMRVANLMAQTSGVQPFSLEPFRAHAVTNAQASGRFGAAFAVTNNTVVRGSFAQIFQPPPVDLFSTPPNLTEDPVGGIYPGTLRPMQATRGNMVDASIEQQMGPRFALRTNVFYKKLKNFGDSGVVQNTPLYNRLTLSNQEAYGVESRLDLKPARDGFGFNGFLSTTVSIAKLRGSKGTTGGLYDFAIEPSTTNYPDHDRRVAVVSGFGYRSQTGFWTLGDVQVLTGLKDSLSPAIFGPQPARTPPLTIAGLNFGYDLPQDQKRKDRVVPAGFDVRIENLLNQRKPLNLGSPFQGTRFMLPIRVVAGMYWKV